MAEIRIEGRGVKMLKEDGDNIFDAGHLYLVYVDDDGEEYVIGGAPSENPLFNSDDVLNVIADVPIIGSQEERVTIKDGKKVPVSREDRGSIVLKLGGRDASAVWQQMVAYAQKIDDAKIGYNSFGPNSNTVIIALLNHVGIDVQDHLPPAKGVDGVDLGPFKFDGIDTEFFKIEPFEIPRIQISSAYPGSEKEDVEYLMKKVEENNNSAPSQPLLHHPEESSKNKTSTSPHRQEGRLPSPSRTDLETPQYAAWKKRKQLSQQRRLNTPPLIDIMPNGRPTPPPVAQERSFSRRQRPNTPPLINIMPNGRPTPPPVAQERPFSRRPNTPPLIDIMPNGRPTPPPVAQERPFSRRPNTTPLIDIMPNGRPTPPPVAQERPFSGQRPANQPSLTDSAEMQKPHEQESRGRVQRALHGSEPPRNTRPLIPLTPPDLTALQSLEWQKSLAQAIRRQRRLREGLIHAPSLLKFSIPE